MNTDLCMFCLDKCYTYINLKDCSCKIITHEGCIEEYLYNKNKNFIKCIICKRSILFTYNTFNYNKYMTTILLNSSFSNSLFYSFFYGSKFIFLYRHSLLRALFIVIFHMCLLLVTFFPFLIFLIIVHIKYIFIILNIAVNMLNCKNKVYRVYNL